MTRSRHLLRPRQPWAPAEIELLRRHYADSLTSDIAAALGRPISLVYSKAHKLGLRKGPEFFATDKSGRVLKGGKLGQAWQFKPGQVPPNKGLRRPGWAPGDMARTQFAAGHKPHTWKPIGSLRINADGYLDRKVTDTGYAPRDWVSVHRLVWIQTHGPIPAGHVVVFKPGRRSTDETAITLDAIELITRRELMARNTVHNLPPELAAVVQLRGALARQINRRAKEEEPA